ncbi:hypothetical protein K0M31_007625 [Melipona bicolor]|uniref:Uncharacterized protein n=1 Tax=Melipona bicolor TaxID=60889 RepID=A0AA40GBR2_9HYME|nr:hypothetical protein K0M31_007625 [Melipona bicolor]
MRDERTINQSRKQTCVAILGFVSEFSRFSQDTPLYPRLDTEQKGEASNMLSGATSEEHKLLALPEDTCSSSASTSAKIECLTKRHTPFVAASTVSLSSSTTAIGSAATGGGGGASSGASGGGGGGSGGGGGGAAGNGTSGGDFLRRSHPLSEHTALHPAYRLNYMDHLYHQLQASTHSPNASLHGNYLGLYMFRDN